MGIEKDQTVGSCSSSPGAANRHGCSRLQPDKRGQASGAPRTQEVTECSAHGRAHQPFPKTGPLARNLNVQLDRLRQKVTEGQSEVYCYIVRTVESAAGTFQQTGSGPNLQGNRITLCTCKHRMRTFKDSDAWKGTWVAGFAGARVAKERNYLVYLMRVAQAFDSHRDLWFSDAVPTATKKAKAAHLHPLGDLFQPKGETDEPFAPHSYIRPRRDHSHAPLSWHQDVSYRGCSNRPAALLVGDPQRSFLWDHPTIYSTFKLYRGQKKLSVDELLRQLKEATPQ